MENDIQSEKPQQGVVDENGRSCHRLSCRGDGHVAHRTEQPEAVRLHSAPYQHRSSKNLRRRHGTDLARGCWTWERLRASPVRRWHPSSKN